jgi:succinate dehydrogenase hydrophobic anchor subunit
MGSWAASAAGGVLSVVFLVIACGALAATVMATIGVIRGRCPWYSIPLYLLLVAIGSFLFRGVFWILERVTRPDAVNEAIFWGTVLIGVVAVVTGGQRLLNEIWQATNADPQNGSP